MYFTFQLSRIWDGANQADATQPKVRVKAKSEERARRRLDKAPLGRDWIRIDE